MNVVFKMAIKDLQILFRDKLGAFFIVGFPILMGVFFGLMMGGGSGDGSSAVMKVVCVDQDQSEISQKFVDALGANESLEIELVDSRLQEIDGADMKLTGEAKVAELQKRTVESARQKVRTGRCIGMIVLPPGFGKTAGVFWGDPPKIQVGVDPSRQAEAGMIQGFIMEAIGGLVGDRLSNPDQTKAMIEQSRKELAEDQEMDFISRQLLSGVFTQFDSMIDSVSALQANEGTAGEGDNSAGLQFADIESLDVSREIDPNSVNGQLQKVRSPWDISFPQAMMWGVLGCVAGFSVSIVREKTMGTMLRLQVAPISYFQILAGKALACFMTVIGVILFLTLLGVLLGMKPVSYPMLALAGLCVSVCFVGIMMTFAVLGKTEQAVSGSGWAINMIMAMIGGSMIPVMFMPGFMQTLSNLSPIKWGILAIEGAIWRDFSIYEMMLPCSILVIVGLIGMTIGTVVLSRRGS